MGAREITVEVVFIFFTIQFICICKKNSSERKEIGYPKLWLQMFLNSARETHLPPMY